MYNCLINNSAGPFAQLINYCIVVPHSYPCYNANERRDKIKKRRYSFHTLLPMS